VTRDELLQWAAKELQHHEGMRDAHRLLSKLDPTQSKPDFSIDEADRYAALVRERKEGRPVAQILGYRDFWKDRFLVTSDVLDPRPETEHVIEAALSLAIPARILDLGTGTGCIALSLAREFPSATIVATDISEKALNVARQNAAGLGFDQRVRFIQSDWFDAVEDVFDLVVSNPPYIASSEFEGLDQDILDYEPRLALSPGEDGLLAYRTIFAKLADHLKAEGHAIFEHGWAQAGPLTKIAETHGFVREKLVKDLSGKERISVFKRNSSF